MFCNIHGVDLECPYCTYRKQQEQKSMTRKEAFKIAERGNTPARAEWLVTALEALGLLKFDEVKKEGPIKRGDFIRVQFLNGSFIQGVVDSLERS